MYYNRLQTGCGHNENGCPERDGVLDIVIVCMRRCRNADKGLYRTDIFLVDVKHGMELSGLRRIKFLMRCSFINNFVRNRLECCTFADVNGLPVSQDAALYWRCRDWRTVRIGFYG